MGATRSEVTQQKALGWLQHDILPMIGTMPVASIKPRDILAVIQRVEARGAIDSAHRMKQMCGQILRYGVAIGWTERDVTPDLRGALMRSHAPTSPPSLNPNNWSCCYVPPTPTRAISWPYRR